MQDWLSAIRRAGGVGVALAVGCASSVTAGETVIFSNPKPQTEPPSGLRSSPSRSLGAENPFETLKPSKGSLQGITARPFAPPRPSLQQPPPLTSRERELLQERRDWILRAPGETTDPGQDLNRAFGVREQKMGGAANESKAPKGDLLRYYERLEAADNSGLPDLKGPPDALRNPGAPPGLAGPGGGEYQQPGDWSLQPRTSPMGFGAVSTIRDSESNPGLNPSGWLETPFGRNSTAERGLERGLSESAGSLARSQPAEELSGVAQILGVNPVVSPISQMTITSLDPITAYPDPTREALNPVLSPSKSLTPPLLPPGMIAAESPGRRTPLSPSAAARGLENPFQAQSSGGKLGEVSLNGKRTLQSIKVQLDLPGRSF